MPIKGSNGGYFYNLPLRVQTSKNTFPPYTPFINGQDPLNGKEPFNHFYLQRTGGLNGERQRQRRTKKQHKRKPSLFLCRHPRVFLSGICCYKLAVILNLFQDLPFGVLVVLLPRILESLLSRIVRGSVFSQGNSKDEQQISERSALAYTRK